jgi:hypothetical protein
VTGEILWSGGVFTVFGDFEDCHTAAAAREKKGGSEKSLTSLKGMHIKAQGEAKPKPYVLSKYRPSREGTN